MSKYVCIHGHFYQPPRENAWLEKVEVQDSAYPFHDWNERVNNECYTPNTASRMLNENGVIKKIVNNYSRISFNFGPTLLSWMEEMAPETYKAIIKADGKSQKRYGSHGSAIAQAYSHMIMPLANSRDIDTQIIWGIKDFEFRFGRYPEGMWLGETAINAECMEAMARHKIKFTVLAPRQASKIRKIGDKDWVDVSGDRVDPRRPYLVNLPSGNTITVFFYDGQVAKDVAFANLLDNGKTFGDRILSSLDKSPEEPQLAHIATDGESYGHHHRHGEMALTYCLQYVNDQPDTKVTNYGEFLSLHPPLYEAEVFENSSWSCVHGVERWRSDCGCHTGGEAGWDQKWRGPLRDALDWLRDTLIYIYDEKSEGLLKNPWEARNEYIDVILDRNKENVRVFLDKHLVNPLDTETGIKALRLLEMQRNAMLMYTSCGWFFNEVSGIETVQILQYASRAIQLGRQIEHINYDEEFISRLEKSKSNITEFKNAGEIYRKLVINVRLSLTRVGMHYAVASLFGEDPENLSIFNYSTKTDFFDRREAGIQKISFGRINIESKTTFSERQFSFVALYLGQHNIIGYISVDMDESTFYSMYEDILRGFRQSNLGKMMELMTKYFGEKRFSIWHLFKDEKRDAFKKIMDRYQGRMDRELRQIFDQDYQLINALANEDIPVPPIYMHTFEYVLNADLQACLQSNNIDINQLKTIIFKFKKWNIKLSKQIPFHLLIEENINKKLRGLSNGNGDFSTLKKLNKRFEIIGDLDINPDLSLSQNLYFEIANNDQIKTWDKATKEEFSLLGNNLQVKI